MAYFHSVSTLNYLRGMIAGGVADLHSAPSWSLEHVLEEDIRNEYSQIIRMVICDSFSQPSRKDDGRPAFPPRH